MLVGILGLNIYGLFVKDHIDQPFVEKDIVINSESCANLSEQETFACLTTVDEAGQANDNDLLLLGQLNLYGMGTTINIPKAISLFEKSAIEGENTEAMVLLGDMLLNKDALSAKYWYARAAQKGDLASQLKLARIYRYGEPQDLNPQGAFELYKQASDKGSLDAKYEMALMYGTGVGVDPNVDRSIFILETPCDQGHQASCELLKQIQNLKAQQNR